MAIRPKAPEDGRFPAIEAYHTPRENGRDTRYTRVDGPLRGGCFDRAAILRDVRTTREREEWQRRLAEQGRREQVNRVR